MGSKWGGGGSGYLNLHYWPPIDWEPAINVDMVTAVGCVWWMKSAIIFLVLLCLFVFFLLTHVVLFFCFDKYHLLVRHRITSANFNGAACRTGWNYWCGECRTCRTRVYAHEHSDSSESLSSNFHSQSNALPTEPLCFIWWHIVKLDWPLCENTVVR